ncbi:MAG: hypothetical protein WAU31_03925, partial [Candidatus Moraniibacteriota bacterium]
MNRHSFIAMFILVLWMFPASFSWSAGNGNVIDYRSNGWNAPVGYRHAEDCYQFGQYPGHVGDDFCRSFDTAVVAIADGCVENYGSGLRGFGGRSGKAKPDPSAYDIPGGAILLRHYTVEGRVFFALYGHISFDDSYLNERRCKKDSLTKVKAGDRIASVAVFTDNGERMDHLHSGIHLDAKDPDKEFRGNGCVGKDGGTLSDNCGWVEPTQFLASNYPATLISKGEKSIASLGQYLFQGSDYCPNANAWYRTVDSSRDDYWVTEVVSQNEACQGVTDTVERMLRSSEENNGVVKTDQVVDSRWKRASSAVISWLSSVVSEIKAMFTWTYPAQAADQYIQQSLSVERSGVAYAIAGTNREILVLTDGPGMNGDKAIDPYSGYQPDPSETLETGLTPSSGRKLPDIGISGEWFERSSGRKHDDVDWGSTLCPTAYVKSKGDGDAPKDVKLSFYLSKDYNEDRSPRHFGYEMISKKDMRTGKSKNVSHCVGFKDGDYPAYPGRYSFTAVANSDKSFGESKMTNNKSNAYSFVIKENAHLGIQFHFLNEVVSGQTVDVAVTISNTGTPFGQDYVYTQYRIQGPEYGENPVIIGFDQTRRDHLRTGDIANEQFSFVVPTTPGAYTVTAEVDYTEIVTQSDRSTTV